MEGVHRVLVRADAVRAGGWLGAYVMSAASTAAEGGCVLRFDPGTGTLWTAPSIPATDDESAHAVFYAVQSFLARLFGHPFGPKSKKWRRTAKRLASCNLTVRPGTAVEDIEWMLGDRPYLPGTVVRVVRNGARLATRMLECSYDHGTALRFSGTGIGFSVMHRGVELLRVTVTADRVEIDALRPASRRDDAFFVVKDALRTFRAVPDPGRPEEVFRIHYVGAVPWTLVE